MKFVDSCEVRVVAGRGGNGSVAFRREKYIPHGGPAGGDGGRGGDVVFVTDPGMSTLLDLTYGHMLKAKDGEHGMGKDCYGKGGEDRIVRVPVGTQVLDSESRVLLYDLDQPNARTVVAHGGKGGRGNLHFATSYDRAPRRAEPGQEGEDRVLRLELKVMADVGLLGFPNVGKSTFIRASSRARPKVADYPFTTLVPHLGVVSVGEDATFVLADIPGLIPGASEGAGLGIRFLKHLERTRALLHLVTLDFTEGRSPMADFDALMHELRAFHEELADKPMITAMSKADLPEVREAYAKLAPRFARRGITLRLVSAATGEGMRELLFDLAKLLRGEQVERLEPPAKKTATPKSAPEKGRAKKPTSNTAAPKKAAVKTPAPKKKAAPKKSALRKVAAKSSAPKKAAPRKVAAKSSAPKKAASKKSATKKTATKKTATKKTATKKTATKKIAAKKIAAKKIAAKKIASRKNAAPAKTRAQRHEKSGRRPAPRVRR